MKTIRRILLGIVFLIPALISHGQSRPLDPGYYIVVSAYAPIHENLAQNFVAALEKEGFKSTYGYNTGSRLFLVYLSFFDNLKGSILEMQRVRKETRFSDAWVRVVPGDIGSGKAEQINSTIGLDSAPGKTGENVSVPEQVSSTMETRVETPAQMPAETDTIEVTDNEEIVQYKKMTLGNTEVFLSLYQARNNRIVDGDVQVIDTDRAKSLVKVKGNEYLLLPDPRSNSGQLTLICEAFGYRKIQHEINYPLPLADTVKPYIELMGTTLVVNFDLVRYHKGDIATLYNVYFFNDASVMMPESRFELNSLLQLMQEGPNYKIRLHGHTNGNYHGKIIRMGANKNFFSLDGSENIVGSAKELSKLRAGVIKEYLVSNGIAPDRIEIKAWGGKRPIFDRNGANAKKNVRVEVEILEE